MLAAALSTTGESYPSERVWAQSLMYDRAVRTLRWTSVKLLLPHLIS